MTDSVQKQLEGLKTDEAKVKFLTTQLKFAKGLFKRQQEITRKHEIGIDMYELELKKLAYPKESCDFGYYEIRSGKCKYGETGGHRGDIYCENPNCTNR